MFNKIILGQVRKDKNIVYGARSIIKQTPYRTFSRTTQDWDIYSTRPRASAKKLGNKLERVEPGKQVAVTPAKHPGTYHVYYRKKDVADFTEQPKNVEYKTIGGIRYSKLSSEVKNKQRALKYKKYAFRYEKDSKDLNVISTHELFSNFRRP